MGRLEGVRVLELGTLIAGPFTGRLLGDFGAEVVKVEAPSGGESCFAMLDSVVPEYGKLGEIPAPGVVPKLSETPGHAREAGSWELGEANREVYGERLGLSDEELERLHEEGVI